MEINCRKCNKIILKRVHQQLTCLTCTQTYHIECANVTEKRFYLMTTENKSKWKCDYCWSKNENEKFNVSTENSFASLSDLDCTGHDFISQNRRLNSSCPDSKKTQNQNNQIKEKLQIAENLLIENSNLKKSLANFDSIVVKFYSIAVFSTCMMSKSNI